MKEEDELFLLSFLTLEWSKSKQTKSGKNGPLSSTANKIRSRAKERGGTPTVIFLKSCPNFVSSLKKIAKSSHISSWDRNQNVRIVFEIGQNKSKMYQSCHF